MNLYPDGYAAPQREPHCGVLSVAICAGVSFERAWAACAANLRKRRGPWRGETYAFERREALQDLGVAFDERTYVPSSLLRRCTADYAERKGLAERCNLASFAKRHAKPGRTYMVQVRGHVVTLRDGIAIDQHQAAPVAEHRAARMLLQTTLEILP